MRKNSQESKRYRDEAVWPVVDRGLTLKIEMGTIQSRVSIEFTYPILTGAHDPHMDQYKYIIIMADMVTEG